MTVKEGRVEILAAFLVLLTSLLDPEMAVVLAVGVLLSLGVKRGWR